MGDLLRLPLPPRLPQITGRPRRRPAAGAERRRRDEWGATWAQAGREVGERMRRKTAS